MFIYTYLTENGVQIAIIAATAFKALYELQSNYVVNIATVKLIGAKHYD